MRGIYRQILPWLFCLLSPSIYAQHSTGLTGNQSDTLSGTVSGSADILNEVAPDLHLKSSHIRKYMPSYSERETLRAARQAKQAVKVAEQQVKAAKQAARRARPGSQAALDYDKARARLKQAQGVSKNVKATHTQALKENSSTRKSLTKPVNKRTKPVSKYTKGTIKNAGIIITIADVGGTLGGHLVEGDLAGAVGAGVNEVPKAGAASVGAMIGGVVGMIGGPPGIAIGSVVGGVAGGYAYSVVVGDAVSDMAEKSVTHPEEDYFAKAVEARAEFLASKQAYINKTQQAKVARELEKQRFIEKARRERAAFLKKQKAAEQQKEKKESFWAKIDSPSEAPVQQTRPKKQGKSKSARREQVQAQKKVLKDKARRKAAAGIDPNRKFESRPVIGQDVTIDAVVWSAEYPQKKFSITYYVRGGQVSGSLKTDIPGHSNERYSCSGSSMTWVVSGQLLGNVLQTHSQGQWGEPRRCVYHGMVGDEPYTCETVYSSNSISSGDVTLNIDGTLVENGSSSWDNSQKVSGHNCNMENFNSSGDSVSHQLLGTWQIRE